MGVEGEFEGKAAGQRRKSQRGKVERRHYQRSTCCSRKASFRGYQWLRTLLERANYPLPKRAVLHGVCCLRCGLFWDFSLAYELRSSGACSQETMPGGLKQSGGISWSGTSGALSRSPCFGSAGKWLNCVTDGFAIYSCISASDSWFRLYKRASARWEEWSSRGFWVGRSPGAEMFIHSAL